jgi:DNA-binding response OmpR family regulator
MASGPPEASGRPAPARVLVIDDDPALLTTLARILASEGFQVDVAADGADGLARARQQPPAVVLLDLHLPVLDGYAFLEAFRSLPACAEVPVVLMTGSQDTASARRRIQARRVMVLMPKPFDMDTLLATVRGAARAARPQAP